MKDWEESCWLLLLTKRLCEWARGTKGTMVRKGAGFIEEERDNGGDKKGMVNNALWATIV